MRADARDLRRKMNHRTLLIEGVENKYLERLLASPIERMVHKSSDPSLSRDEGDAGMYRQHLSERVDCRNFDLAPADVPCLATPGPHLPLTALPGVRPTKPHQNPGPARRYCSRDSARQLTVIHGEAAHSSLRQHLLTTPALGFGSLGWIRPSGFIRTCWNQLRLHPSSQVLTPGRIAPPVGGLGSRRLRDRQWRHTVRSVCRPRSPPSLRPRWIFADGCDGLYTVDAEPVPQVGHRAVTLVCPS